VSRDSESLAPSTRAIYAAFDAVGARKGTILLALALVALTAFLASGLYVVKKEERAVLTRFGKVVDDDVTPGIHYAIPLVDQAHLRKVTRIVNRNVMTKGDSEQVAFSLLSGDANLFEASVALQYRISDLRSWLFATSDPETILTLIVRERLIGVMGRNYIDLIFSTNRDIIQDHLFDEVTAWLEEEDIGIELLTLSITDLQPIEETVAAFRDVNDAIAEGIRMVSSATRKAEQLIARSRGQAGAVVLKAKARAREREVQAAASAEAFRDLMDAYRDQSDSVIVTRYWQRMRTILKKATISAVDSGNTAALDINMIDGFAPGVGQVPGMVMPADGSSRALVGARSWLAALSEGSHRDLDSTERDAPELSGRFHSPSGERHHYGATRPQSLLFDDLAIFGHRDVVQSSISTAADESEAPLAAQDAEVTDAEDDGGTPPTEAAETGSAALAEGGAKSPAQETVNAN